jgi:DNA processing protein
VTSASSAGCHRLLRDYDAQCVTSAQDVRELCGELDQQPATTRGWDPNRTRVLDAMNARTRLSVEEIARRSGLSPGRVRSMLGLLQLEGDVELDGAGWHRASSPTKR